MEDKTNEGNTKLSSIYRHITASIPDQKCPPNKINNQKYTLITFIPKIFWSQVSQFFDFVILGVPKKVNLGLFRPLINNLEMSGFLQWQVDVIFYL